MADKVDGSIRFEVDVDTDEMKKLDQSVKNTADEGKKQIEDMANQIVEGMKKSLGEMGNDLTAGITDGIKEALGEAQQATQESAEGIADSMSGITDAFSGLSGGMVNIIGLIDGALNKLPAILDLILAITTPLGPVVFWPKAINKIGQELGTVFGRLKQIAGGIGQKVINGLKSLVSGGGGGGGILDKIVSGLNRVKSMILSVMIFNQLSKALKSFTDNVEEALYKDEAFASAMGTLKGNIVTAFMPIWQIAVPAVTALINVLAKAAGYIAQFTALLTGSTVEAAQAAAQAFHGVEEAAVSSADAQDKASKTAAKANDRFLASFDTIQKIGSSSSGGGGGTAGGGNTATSTGISTGWNPQNLFTPNVGTDLAKSLASAIKSGDWSAVGAALSSKLTGVFTKIGSLIDWETIKPKVENLAKKISGFLKGVNWTEMLGSLGTTIGKAFTSIVRTAAELIASVPWDRIAKGVASFFKNLFKNVDWEGVGASLQKALKSVIKGLNAFFREFDWSGLGTTLGKAAKTILNLLVTFLKETDWGRLFRGVVTTVKTAIKTLIEETDWGKVWEAVQNVFEGIGEGIRAVIGAAVPFARDPLNRLIGAFETVCNSLKDTFNEIAKVYNTVAYKLGLKLIPLNLNRITFGRIPALADGAVIPANNEFLAVLGDQKHGTNIEAPESLIRRIVREEGGGNAEMLAVLQGILSAVRSGSRIELNGRELGRAVRRELGNTGRASGTSVIPT